MSCWIFALTACGYLINKQWGPRKARRIKLDAGTTKISEYSCRWLLQSLIFIWRENAERKEGRERWLPRGNAVQAHVEHSVMFRGGCSSPSCLCFLLTSLRQQRWRSCQMASDSYYVSSVELSCVEMSWVGLRFNARQTVLAAVLNLARIRSVAQQRQINTASQFIKFN